MSSGAFTGKRLPHRQREVDKYTFLYECPREKKTGRVVQYGSIPEWRKLLLKNYYTEVLKVGGTRVLDVGCGWAESLKIAHEVGVGYHGVEVVPKLCESPAITLVDGAHALPFPDQSFDAISCVDVLEHIPEQDVGLVFDELARVAPEALIGISLRESAWRRYTLHITLRDQLWWTRKLLESFRHVGTYPYSGNEHADTYLVVRVEGSAKTEEQIPGSES